MKFLKIDDTTFINIDAIDAVYMETLLDEFEAIYTLKITTRSGWQFIVMQEHTLPDDKVQKKKAAETIKKRMNELIQQIKENE